MGWELRHGGRRYLYWNRRVNGKPQKVYLAAEGDFGDLMANNLHRFEDQQRRVRELTRKTATASRARIDELVADVAAANAALKIVSDGLLCAMGYHRHHRGEWRMKRELANLKNLIEGIKGQVAVALPLVKYEAPANDAEATEAFAKARAGDNAALGQVRALIRDRKWANWLGDLGEQATHQLIHKAAGGDPVWVAGIAEKVTALRQQLLGDSPTVLEELLVRRVVNGWLAVHALELELTIRPPVETRQRAHLDAALTRAQRRFTEAINRTPIPSRLQAPKILAQLNLALPNVGGTSGATVKG